jgi:GMP synthase-like glutamine amidotransferase
MSDNEQIEPEKENYILLVDNYLKGFPTDRITRLETIIRDSIANVKSKTVHYTKFNSKIAENSIGVILSGSNMNVSDFYFNNKLKRKFIPQLEFFKEDHDIPVLALCFGLHLVAYAWGIQVCRIRIPSFGGRIIFILLDKTDDIVPAQNIPVNAHHRDFISPNDCILRNEFDILSTYHAREYRTVQYMKHKEKPIYCLQFHPETHNPNYFNPNLFDERITTKTRMIGKEIIENFIWLCSYKQEQDNL